MKKNAVPDMAYTFHICECRYLELRYRRGQRVLSVQEKVCIPFGWLIPLFLYDLCQGKEEEQANCCSAEQAYNSFGN